MEMNKYSSANLAKCIVLMLYASLCLNCFSGFCSFAPLLPEEEVKVLQTISWKLKIQDWDVSQGSCSGGMGFNGTIVEKKILSNVTCDCSYNSSTVCHIKTIQLKGYNLSGDLPAEFANLEHLMELDLSRNYLSGSIPTAFARLPLTILRLLGNRIRGVIPKEIGDIGTLEVLNLEDNLLEGPLPDNLGRLSRLRELLLSANNFNGTIPESFSNLKNLTDFRIDGSNMSGRIPDWIGNWARIKKLHMQGTSLTGPIPSTISQLKNLTELRISDVDVPTTGFPNLQYMENMEFLMLRNCSIIGEIPDYFEDMPNLKTLDLSFNNLIGRIPFQRQLDKLDNLFLSHNALTGAIPDWILKSQKWIDVSYNNFTRPSDVRCTSSSVNAVSSYSNSSIGSMPWCSKKGLPCSRKPKHTSLFINCGGSKTKFDGKEYEQDDSIQGPSYFYLSSEKWAHSSTGLFLGENSNARFAVSNTLLLNVTDGEIYKTARQSPASLKYYGLCIRKGSYRVQLHFAELMFSNDVSFVSLGRRIFDVAIQGRVVLTNFNIMEAAKGAAGKGVVREFNVSVNGSTLEIHLYWTGKGTTAIPERNVHGPLISAIAVTPNFHVDTGGLSAGAIAGIVASSCMVVLSILLLLWKKGYLGRKNVEGIELRVRDLQTGHFTLRQIKFATNNFDPSNKIGEGGFGSVYKGVLADGAAIAVKQLSAKSQQGNREFVNEIGMISALQHPNLVKLYGCCVEGNQLLLIYEYMENNSLALALFCHEGQRLNLDWQTRKKICLGIARGLAYLHEESRVKIVHRDIKATNVLLDKDLNAKISDFGLARLNEEENTHISTRIAGTVGYMAPEYAMRGYLTDKADVYCFGIVVLEIVSGKSNTNYRPKEEFVYLLDWAYVLEEQDNLIELVDSSLGSNYPKEEAMSMLNLALLCANSSPTLRPSMSSVVSMLEGKIPVHAQVIKRGVRDDDARFKAFEKLSQDNLIHVSKLSQDSQVVKTASTDGPWIDSSSSLPVDDEIQDRSLEMRLLPGLYDVNLD